MYASETLRDWWLDRIQIALEDVGPGIVTPPDVTLSIAMAFEELTWLRPDQYVHSPFGYPPLPIPLEGREDGARRVPSTVNPDFARHPVWWLDSGSARRRPGEDNWVYVVRLYLELEFRGLWDAEEGGWVDFFWINGIDIEDPEVQKLVERYLQGEPVSQLCALGTSPLSSEDREQIAKEAEVTVEAASAILAELEGAAQEELWAAVDTARERLVEADFAAVSQSVVDKLVVLQQTARAGQELRPAWEAVRDAARDVEAAIDALAYSAAEAALPTLQVAASTPEEYLSAVETLLAVGEQNEQYRHITLNDALSAFRTDATSDGPYAAFIAQMKEWYEEGTHRLAVTLSETRRVEEGTWTPPGEEEAGAELGPAPVQAPALLTAEAHSGGHAPRAADVFDISLPSTGS